MSNGKFLSVIIPVYKTEKFLNKCVDSLLFATKDHYKDIEIILVNDGSPDNCGLICDGYAKKYNFIKVIHKQNEGVSEARNDGIRKAVGKYITFIDSDDYVLPSFSKVFEVVQESITIDIYSFGFMKQNKKFSCFDKTLNSKNNNDLIWFAQNKVSISACVKISRLDFLKENNIFFTKTIYSEDFEWSIRCLIASEYYKLVPICYYVYYTNPLSVTHTYSALIFYDHFKNISLIATLLDGIQMKKEQRKKLYSYLFENSYFITGYRKLAKTERQQVLQILADNKEYFYYPAKFKYKILFFMIKIFGIKTTAKLIGLFFK